MPDRVALAGIRFVPRTGIQWRDVPAGMGCGGKTCWRRLVKWHRAGIWRAPHRTLLERLLEAGRLDWKPGVPGQRVRSRQRGRAETGPSPTDRGKAGTKRHRVVNGEGTSPGVTISGANRHDSRMMAPTLDAMPPIRGRRGRPRCRANQGCDHRRRRGCRARGIVPRVARRGIESDERLGRH